MSVEPMIAERPTWRTRLQNRGYRFLQWALEDQADKGLGGPPNDWRAVTVVDRRESSPGCQKSHTMGFTNDAFELVIGTTYDEGKTHDSVNNLIIRVEPFRKLALWYLWRWAWGEWFGLRRWLFYKWLHWKVQGYERQKAAWAAQHAEAYADKS